MTKQDIINEWFKYCEENNLIYYDDFEDMCAELEWLQNKYIEKINNNKLSNYIEKELNNQLKDKEE